jgi:DNA ligase-1
MSTNPLARQVMPGRSDAESADASDGAVRARDSLFHWCGTVDAIGAARTPDDKQRLLDAYFAVVAEETVEPAARFFTGRLVSTGDLSTRVTESVVSDAIHEVGRIDLEDFRARCARNGDMGAVAAEVFAGRLPSGLPVSEVGDWADDLAMARGTPAERELVVDMMGHLSSLEARYVVRLLLGRLDVGLGASDVDRAIAFRRAQPESHRAPDRRRGESDAEEFGRPSRRRRSR